MGRFKFSWCQVCGHRANFNLAFTLPRDCFSGRDDEDPWSPCQEVLLPELDDGSDSYPLGEARCGCQDAAHTGGAFGLLVYV